MFIIKREYKKWLSLGIIVVFIITLLFYGFLVEPNKQAINTSTMRFTSLPTAWENTKIVYLSDMMLGSNYTSESLEKTIRKINNENPDIIFFAGDLFDVTAEKLNVDDSVIIEQLKTLKAPLGKYAFLPQTQSATLLEDTKSILTYADFQILTNEQRYIYNRTLEPLNLIALNQDATTEQKQQLLDASQEQISILISEDPALFDTLAQYSNIKLTLSYGTYGGNIGIPFLNKYLADTDYPANFYKNGEQRLLVSVGIGTPSAFSFRFFNQPKIYTITLQSQK